jgi:hypothetical protein
MKFSDLLGEPEPEPESDLPGPDAEPISVFAPVPTPPAPPVVPAGVDPAPPGVTTASGRRELTEPPLPGPAIPEPPPGSRSGLAELNVRRPVPETPVTDDSSVLDQLVGLTEIVDDLLPSARRARK